MNRRPFIKQIAMGIPLVVGANVIPQAANNCMVKKKRIKPKRLKKGDLIALISPGGPVTEAKIELAIKNMESMGLKTKLAKNLRAKRGYTAGTDAQRLEDLHWAFSDTSINGVWCVRGGYGCTRLLPKINYKLLKKNPKVLIGFSDITALLYAVFKETGLVGFHGPIGAWDLTAFNRDNLLPVIMDGKSNHSIGKSATTEILVKGKASGQLIGGNLTLLAALAGTPYSIDADDKIVFIEDVGEKPYRIDRMLTQLRQSINLEKARGILLGEFIDCEAKEGSDSLSLMDTLKDRLGDLNIPIIYNFPFGHRQNLCTLPFGIEVELDAVEGKVNFKESAVV